MTEGLSDESLAELFATIGNPTRLRILRSLTEPRAMNEITVKGHRADAAQVVARQTVRTHLDQLLAKGFVVARPNPAASARGLDYVVNHQAFSALAEEVRNLARMRPVVEPSLPTSKLGASPTTRTEGPRLLVTRGLHEGRLVPLGAPRPRSWVVGRRRDVDVALDYDPFISSENSLIDFDGDRYWLADVPGSRNGTHVNQRRLMETERHELRHGDLIEVGRSALLFWQ